jgi:hypothetical protein
MARATGKNEWLVLAACVLLGAALAAILIRVAQRSGMFERASHAALASAPRPTEPCALRTTTEPCDRCLESACRTACEDCASNAWCVKLYACVLECSDEACNRACAKRFAEGKAALDAFAGENGCMAANCREACR